MKKLIHIPLKWKLTIWSASLLFLLFSVYSTIQYFSLVQSMIQQEQEDMQKSMSEILNYILERETNFGEEDLSLISDRLNKVLQKNQMVRIRTVQDNKSITVSTGVAPENVEDMYVSEPKWFTDHESSILILRSPFSIFQTEGTVELASSISHVKKLSDDMLKVIVIFGLIAILISAIGGSLLTVQLLKPLQSMTNTIIKIRKNGLRERVAPLHQNDEISILMTQFNEMMDQLEGAFQQQNRFIQDASHELKTPIAIMEGHISLLRRWGKSNPEVLQESLNITFDELERLKTLVNDLLTLFQVEQEILSKEDEYCDPVEISTTIIQQLSLIHGPSRFRMITKEHEQAIVAIPELRLSQILHILLDNALKYSTSNSTITITCSSMNHYCKLEIKDNGVGIPPENLPFVMDRFYRVDKARNQKIEGYGLGLSIARSLVERYKGEISIHSELGKGTTVSFALPLLNIQKGG